MIIKFLKYKQNVVSKKRPIELSDDGPSAKKSARSDEERDGCYQDSLQSPSKLAGENKNRVIYDDEDCDVNFHKPESLKIKPYKAKLAMNYMLLHRVINGMELKNNPFEGEYVSCALRKRYRDKKNESLALDINFPPSLIDPMLEGLADMKANLKKQGYYNNR